MIGSPAYRDWTDEARAVPIERALGKDAAGLKRGSGGRELVGPCPVCGGTDRFSVSLAKGVFNCRGAGRGGDVIELVRYLRGCDFHTACEILTGRPKPGGEPETDEARCAREAGAADRAARSERDAAARADREARRALRERDRAHAIWAAGRPISGTLAEAYLRHRALEVPAGARLRFAPQLGYFHGSDERGAPRQIGSGPALLAAVTATDEEVFGRFEGVHVTWLDPALGGGLPEAASGKALIVHPETGEVLPSRKIRGAHHGAAIELARVARPRRLILGEGHETTLAVWRALRERRPHLLADCAVWAAVSLGNLSGRAIHPVPHPTLRHPDGSSKTVPGPAPDLASRAVEVPASVETLVLLGDGDSEPFFTACALERCARRHSRRPDGRPREITIVEAPAGEDWNDVLMRKAA